MDIRKVKKLIELLEESGISEIEISEGEESVRISRYPKPGTVTTTVAAAANSSWTMASPLVGLGRGADSPKPGLERSSTPTVTHSPPPSYSTT